MAPGPWQENLRGQPKLNTVSEKTMCPQICLANEGDARPGDRDGIYISRHGS